MADSSSIGVVATVISITTGLIGLIVGAALSLIGKGKRDQRIESSLSRSHERHDESERKFSSLDAAIRTMTAAFTRADGEPRFVSKVVCEGEQSACHAALVEKFSVGNVRFGTIEKQIQELKDTQSVNLQIIINEIRKKKDDRI